MKKFNFVLSARLLVFGLLISVLLHTNSVEAKEWIGSDNNIYPVASIKLFNFLSNQLMWHLVEVLLKVVLLTSVCLLACILVNRAFKLIEDKVKNLGTQVEDIAIKIAQKISFGRTEIIKGEEVTNFLKKVISITKFIILACIALIYIQVLLSLFPHTQSISSKVLESIFNSGAQIFQGLVNYLPKLIFLIVLSVIAFYTLKLIRFIFKEIEAGHFSLPGFEAEWSAPTLRITQFFTVLLFCVIAFPYLPGSGSDIFKGISIFVGILFSLGSSSAITNIVAGILLTYTRAFRIGDEVEIDGIAGSIVEKGFLTTRILIGSNNRFVSIPNSKVLNSNVVNLRATPNARDDQYPAPAINIQIQIPHKYKWQDIHNILREAALATDGILKEPLPRVTHSTIGNFYTIYVMKVASYSPTSAMVNSALFCNIKDKLAQAGINLESPQHIVYENITNEVNSKSLF